MVERCWLTSFKVDRSPGLHAFIYDAKRFALSNRSGIEYAPLQIYCAALLFAPKMSIIRSNFEQRIAPWIQRRPRVRVNWNAELQMLEGHSRSVDLVAFSPDSKLIVSCSVDRTVRLWDVVTGVALQTLEGHSRNSNPEAFSQDRKLVVSYTDWTVRLWDVMTGVALRRLIGHSNRVNSVAFSPDGKHIVSGSLDRTVRVWDVVTGTKLQTFKGHSACVSSVAFSPDSNLIASGSTDRTVWVWDVVTGVALHTLKGNSGSIYLVAFSLDGNLVASGSEDCTWDNWDFRSVSSDDYTVQLWDAKTGVSLQTHKGHPVTFSADGKLSTLFKLNGWIRQAHENVIWLPEDFRTDTVTVHNGMIAIGCHSGNVSFLQIAQGVKFSLG